MKGKGPDGFRGPAVASWPHWYSPNPYLRLFHRALAAHGVRHVPDVPVDPSVFRGSSPRADLLHLHWVYPLWRTGTRWPWGRWLAIREAVGRLREIKETGTPVLWTVHNVEPHDGFRWGERRAYAALHRLVDLRIYHSESAREEALSRFGKGGGESLVVRHGNFDGVFPSPAPEDSVRSREGIAPARRLLLCFGQVRDYKGFDVAVRATGLLDPGEVHLLVAGRPFERNGALLKRLAGTRNDVALVLNEIDAQRLSDLLGAADAVLLPYREVTGSGVLLHALTAGRGVIASDLPYFREILSRSPTAGVLVPPDDARALARGIRTFFDRPVERRGRAARRIADEFEWEQLVRPLADWIHARCSRRGVIRG